MDLGREQNWGKRHSAMNMPSSAMPSLLRNYTMRAAGAVGAGIPANILRDLFLGGVCHGASSCKQPFTIAGIFNGRQKLGSESYNGTHAPVWIQIIERSWRLRARPSGAATSHAEPTSVPPARLIFQAPALLLSR